MAAFIATAPAASASDGVAEINHTCAVQTGCFAGDAVGYPITIDGQAGQSYRLTGDLIVPDENTDGILVSAENVSINLGGFEISGPVVCDGLTCTPSFGSGSGVERSSSFLHGISVQNGSIRGMGAYGVLLGLQSVVKDLRVRWNRIDGVNVGSASTVATSTSYRNGSRGIVTSDAGIVSGNVVYLNQNDGIAVGVGSTVSGNTARANADDGISASSSVVISGNSVDSNLDEGIIAGSGSTIQRNAVRDNEGYGLSLGATAAYRENVIDSNTAGTVVGGVNMFSNSCNGTTTCP